MVTNEELKEAMALNVQLASRYPGLRDDLISCGNESIVRRMAHYDPAKGSFAGYVRIWLTSSHRSAFIDAIAGVHVPSHIARKSEGISRVEIDGMEVNPLDAIRDEPKDFTELYEAIQKLEPRQRAVVDRVFLDGEKASVVAKELGISRRLIYQWMAKALRQLRSMIEPGSII